MGFIALDSFERLFAVLGFDDSLIALEPGYN